MELFEVLDFQKRGNSTTLIPKILAEKLWRGPTSAFERLLPNARYSLQNAKVANASWGIKAALCTPTANMGYLLIIEKFLPWFHTSIERPREIKRCKEAQSDLINDALWHTSSCNHRVLLVLIKFRPCQQPRPALQQSLGGGPPPASSGIPVLSKCSRRRRPSELKFASSNTRPLSRTPRVVAWPRNHRLPTFLPSTRPQPKKIFLILA